jgi:hypothetical protein
MQQQETIEFLKSIYSLWEDEELPVEIREDVESEVGLLIFQGVVAISSIQLKKPEQETLEKLFDTNAPMHEIVSFLETHVKNFPEVVKKVGQSVMSMLKENA